MAQNHSDTRNQLIHYARALLQQARHFRKRGDPFFFFLMNAAGKARRDAMLMQEKPFHSGVQSSMF